MALVVALNATLGPYSVNCVGGIYFNNVIVTNGMSAGGDSGSILLSNAGGAVGLRPGRSWLRSKQRIPGLRIEPNEQPRSKKSDMPAADDGQKLYAFQ
jgi:hypothetical protein